MTLFDHLYSLIADSDRNNNSSRQMFKKTKSFGGKNYASKQVLIIGSKITSLLAGKICAFKGSQVLIKKYTPSLFAEKKSALLNGV